MSTTAGLVPPRGRGRWRDVDGILLLDKPEGQSSNAALQQVRRLLRARKAGHTGSLDPLATGLLPVCLGQGTKVCGLLLESRKTYSVSIALGEQTATGDREGAVIDRAPVPALSADSVRRIAATFLGASAQVPPMFSARKHRGERLYRLARRGVEVERPAQPVFIERIDLQGVEARELRFEIECSKGTYVRTLAEDLARACGTVGHISQLRRVSLGPFQRPVMHDWPSLEAAAAEPETLDAMLLPIDAALAGLPEVRLGTSEQACVLQGQPVFHRGPPGARVRMYGVDSLFVGVGRMTADGVRLAPERIMVDLDRATRRPA